MTVPAYITNDTCISGREENEIETNQPTMLLLTGPNYSGKSVYMKQVALIAYMAQVGSFVPAEKATLGITDRILTRINTAETVTNIQSAFATDLQQISFALETSTRRSLLIIDEFGKGTDSCDGAGLASSVFRYLLDRGSGSPKVLASTHFHEIFERGDFDHYQNLAFAHMEVRIDERHSHDQRDKVTYLYNLRPGRSTLSYGNQCASMSGIPDKIIQRAVLLADLIIGREDLIAHCASLSEGEIEELEEADAVARQFLEIELDTGGFAPNSRYMLDSLLTSKSESGIQPA